MPGTKRNVTVMLKSCRMLSMQHAENELKVKPDSTKRKRIIVQIWRNKNVGTMKKKKDIARCSKKLRIDICKNFNNYM